MKFKRYDGVIVEAFQFTADETQERDPAWIVKALQEGIAYFARRGTPDVMLCVTEQGTKPAVTIYRGDWVILDEHGYIVREKEYLFPYRYFSM